MLENFGFKQDICSERIKKLREKYKITMKTVAKYCSQQNEANFSQSTLSLWENGKRIPTIDNFSRVADLFAVDLNWLIGRSDEIYSEGVIKNLELASFPVNITTENITVELMVDIPEDYLDYEKRRTTYSLEARANIVFLFTILKYEWEEYINDDLKRVDIRDSIDDFIEEWNGSDDERRLAVFLGLNSQEEDVWIDESDEALKELLDKQKEMG